MRRVLKIPRAQAQRVLPRWNDLMTVIQRTKTNVNEINEAEDLPLAQWIKWRRLLIPIIRRGLRPSSQKTDGWYVDKTYHKVSTREQRRSTSPYYTTDDIFTCGGLNTTKVTIATLVSTKQATRYSPDFRDTIKRLNDWKPHTGKDISQQQMDRTNRQNSNMLRTVAYSINNPTYNDTW